MKKIRLISAISLLGMLCLFLLLAKKGSSNQFIHRMAVLPNLVATEKVSAIRGRLTVMQSAPRKKIQFKEKGVELGESSSIIHSNFELNKNYAFYDGILILDNDIYEKNQEGVYCKEGDLFEDVGIYIPHKQFGKYLFVNWGVLYYIVMEGDWKNWEHFREGQVISKKTEDCGMRAFYIYDDKLLYYLLPERWEDTKMDADIGLYQTQWPFRESEEFPVDSFTEHGGEIGINFGPREDGTIYIQDEETEGNYFLRKDEDGSWREEFIAPYSWTREYFVKFNQQGVIYYGKRRGYWMLEVLREDGTLETLDWTRHWDTLNRLFLDDYYFELSDEVDKWYPTGDGMLTLKAERQPASIRQYDYEGNVVAFYLFDQSLWEEGYFYKKVVYLEGRLVVFLEQKGTGKLLMGEIILDADLDGEDAAY